MKDYVIITDSCCDLTAKLAESAELTVIPLLVSMEGKDYYNYLDGREIASGAFYDKLRAGSTATTAAINPDVFTTVFEETLQQGKDILYLGFSSGLSSTYHASTLAAEELSAKYPDSKIYCVDTLAASMGQGLLVYLAAQKKQDGATIEEVRDFVEQNKLNLCHWFTVDDLNHLKRGGRVSAATALVGTMLNIKPVLHVDDEGHLINVGKARGRKASIESLFNHMKESAINPSEQTVFISHGDCEQDALTLKNIVEKELSPKEIHINTIGPVIGAHSGPGTLALFFLGDKR
ncbi:MAG: DegV family protein [Acutalibacteraceae bacterium]